MGNRVSAKDYYAILGVTPADSLRGIRSAYRRLAKVCHPDRAGTQGKRKFQDIQEAYEIISDKGKRKEYDASVDRRERIRRTSGIEPEPLVPSHHRWPVSSLEPLITPVYPPEKVFVPSKLSPCAFCNRLGRDLEPSCPFCQGIETVESDLARFIVNCLRAFRVERF